MAQYNRNLSLNEHLYENLEHVCSQTEIYWIFYVGETDDIYIHVKVKQSRYRPAVAQSIPGS